MVFRNKVLSTSAQFCWTFHFVVDKLDIHRNIEGTIYTNASLKFGLSPVLSFEHGLDAADLRFTNFVHFPDIIYISDASLIKKEEK